MVASNVPGASVLKDTPGCGSAVSMADTLDVTGYNTITSTTLHISIGKYNHWEYSKLGVSNSTT